MRSEYNIINPDLTDEQKKIMFDEATERAGSSILNREKKEKELIIVPIVE